MFLTSVQFEVRPVYILEFLENHERHVPIVTTPVNFEVPGVAFELKLLQWSRPQV